MNDSSEASRPNLNNLTTDEIYSITIVSYDSNEAAREWFERAASLFAVLGGIVGLRNVFGGHSFVSFASVVLFLIAGIAIALALTSFRSNGSERILNKSEQATLAIETADLLEVVKQNAENTCAIFNADIPEFEQAWLTIGQWSWEITDRANRFRVPDPLFTLPLTGENSKGDFVSDFVLFRHSTRQPITDSQIWGLQKRALADLNRAVKRMATQVLRVSRLLQPSSNSRVQS